MPAPNWRWSSWINNSPKKRDRKKIIKDIDSELLSSKKAKLIYKKQVERNNDA